MTPAKRTQLVAAIRKRIKRDTRQVNWLAKLNLKGERSFLPKGIRTMNELEATYFGPLMGRTKTVLHKKKSVKRTPLMSLTKLLGKKKSVKLRKKR